MIDCHNFPSVALPYEMADSPNARPDLCIGADDFHTSDELAGAFTAAFRRGDCLVKSIVGASP
ncbi:MAG: hypothetical protein KBE42_03165 [Steroidobacteraceae bacterium]|nr:hypothetical protein [Steroidobacteraceae bacterium]